MPKTQMSRFHIHDDLSAPEGSLPILKGASSAAGQLPNFLGALANSPAALKAFVRASGELRHGSLKRGTIERISLAVAEHYHSKPGIQLHMRSSRIAGLGIDEVAKARAWESGDPREDALLKFLQPLLHDPAKAPHHLLEEAKEAGWNDEQLLEAIAVLSLESFTALVNLAGEIPVDGSHEETRMLRAA